MVTWGNSTNGGSSSAVSASLASGVASVSLTVTAMAALKTDGSVVTWGNTNNGGNSSAVSASLASGVVEVIGNFAAFAARKSDGSVVAWGNTTYGGDSSAVSASLGSGVTALQATNSAFAALKSDGSVVAWGNDTSGGSTAAVASQLSSGVVQIVPGIAAFAALKNDGTVVAWGNTSFGGDASAVSAQLTGVTALYTTGPTFVALRNDGSLVTWGSSSSAAVSSSLTSGFSDLSLSSLAVCFLRGTLILTSRGEVAVQELRAGDLVVTRFGGLRPIRWIGTQRFHPRFAGPRNTPIRFAPGSLGEGIPSCPLHVSPGHAMLLGDVLAHAGALVNGRTITQPPFRGDSIDYFHLDLGPHDCVLANGAWAESYFEDRNREAFHNAADFHTRFPGHEAVRQQTCLPIVTAGDPRIDALHAKLAAAAMPRAA